MRFEIEGYEDYQIDETGQVYRKPCVWAFGASIKARDEMKLKERPGGRYVLRRKGRQHSLTKEQLEQLTIKGGNDD